MTGKQAGKPLSFKACVMMRLADKIHAKLGKILGLHAVASGSFFSRYTSPADNRLSQPKIGSITQTALVIGRIGYIAEVKQ
ncbi:DUF4102 domain-containing protein [Serratia silvae]|uniref:DUF4102 domain-containing protein n=1 Tax=Serratia silvae TaxID=2824122 RepID=A0ABT0K6Y1_9GAMM|nr:DUF4102 domain-containing protein [Serratia silvae]MCL1027756.1 DUF4102 domain-containing protein [Serratia silvae]